MKTRIIKITECADCWYRESFMKPLCELESRQCPPTGTPDWCPLEVLEEKGGGECR